MRAKTTVKVFSWIFMALGFLGIFGAMTTSSFDEPNWATPLMLIAIAMAGFCFLAYLDKSNPG